MKIQEKPDYLIFADSAKKGENAEFPDVGRGWGITIDQTASKPPMEWMNGAFNRIDKNMLYLLQQGVPEWSEKVTYPVNAIIKYNGVLYTAIVENENSIPTTSTTKWKKTQAEIPIANTHQKGIVQLNSSTNSTSEADAATPFAVKKTYDFAADVKSVADTAISKSNNAQHTADIAHNIASAAVKKGDEFHYYGALGDKIINNLGAHHAGVYFQNTYSEAYPERGYPIRDAGALTVLRTEGDGDQGCVQIYTLYKSGRQFIRNYRGSATNGYWEPWVEQITTANADLIVPVGVPLPYPLATPPTGWLKCNGWPFDKNKYPRLAAVYPSGFLPELRGETVRGWDDGRGVDPGRQILSWQGDAMRNIQGEISPISETFGSAPVATGAFKYFEKISGHTPTSIDVGSVGGVLLDISNIVPTAHENRVRSVAYLYIVKAE